MTDKKQDIEAKGAVVQRDRQTYSIAPHIPGGVCDVATLRRLADVAEKYDVQAVKITSAQRIMLIGLKEEDLDDVWRDLGMAPGHAIGLCVRSVKICPGATWCRLAVQDSLALGGELDRRYHGYELPSKCKIGVSGCPNSCGESWVKDLGFIGTAKGWRVVVGGNAGAKPAIARELAVVPDQESALALAERVLAFYSEQTRRVRLGRAIELVGFDVFKEAVDVDDV